MDVLPVNSDVYTDSVSNSENPESGSMDFFNLILSMNAQAIEETPLPESQESDEKPLDLPVEDDQTAQLDPQWMAPFLLQELNPLINPLPPIIESQVEDINSDPMKLEVTIESKAEVSPDVSPVVKDKTTVFDEILDSPVAEATVSSMLPEINSDNKTSIKKPEKTDTQVTEDKSLSLNDEKEMTEFLKITTDNHKIETVSPSVIPTTPDANMNQDNKYVAALSQLGVTLNEHTMRHAHQEPIIFDKIGQVDYAETMRKPLLPDYKVEVELLPATIGSVMKDTYNANIKIHPPELGHVLAKLKIDKNSAELIIMTENNIVKQIVEANLPQLREHFQNADINLTQIQVQTSPSGTKDQSNQFTQAQQNTTKRENSGDVSDDAVSPKTVHRDLNALVDTYA